MRIKPILFSTPMVQATLQGRKTQTRRIIKPQPEAWVTAAPGQRGVPYKKTNKIPHKNSSVWMEEDGTKYEPLEAKYKNGDILWVRETFEYVPIQNASVKTIEDDVQYVVRFKADNIESFSKWKPSIFMPKKACRLFLEVTNVRVELLHDISNNDAKSEGIEAHYLLKKQGYMHYTKPDKFIPFGDADAARTSFFSLWMSINGDESLDKNPWVWAYDFKRVEKPANF